MWIVIVAALYCLHEVYSYFMPWYWNKTASCKNGEEERVRMRDILASSNFEEATGFQVLEWGFGPHYTYHVRVKLAEGHAHPDDARQMSCTGLNRRNRYREHYTAAVGDKRQKKMIAGF